MTQNGETPIAYTYRIQLVALDDTRATFGPTLGEAFPTLTLDLAHWVGMGRPGEVEITPRRPTDYQPSPDSEPRG